jgi:hypothetical protein
MNYEEMQIILENGIKEQQSNIDKLLRAIEPLDANDVDIAAILLDKLSRVKYPVEVAAILAVMVIREQRLTKELKQSTSLVE